MYDVAAVSVCAVCVRVCLPPPLQVLKRERKDYIINTSKEYSIVSPFTSFVAIEVREEVGGAL